MSANDGDRVFEPYLREGETLIWAGIPQQGICFRLSDLFLVPFSIFWGGFVFIWNVMVWFSDAPIFFKLLGLPFLAIGFYVTVGRFLIDMAQRARTDYALTNERVLIVDGLFNANLSAIYYRRIDALHLKNNGGGRGTITFGNANPWHFWFTSPWNLNSSAPEFFKIRDAENVYKKIEDLIYRAQTASSP